MNWNSSYETGMSAGRERGVAGTLSNVLHQHVNNVTTYKICKTFMHGYILAMPMYRDSIFGKYLKKKKKWENMYKWQTWCDLDAQFKFFCLKKKIWWACRHKLNSISCTKLNEMPKKIACSCLPQFGTGINFPA